MKTCKDCRALKPLDEFYSNPNARDGHFNYCKPCHKERRNQNRRDNPERTRANARHNYSSRKRRDRHLRRSYGITIDDYEAILRSQGGVCAICRHSETATRVDSGCEFVLAVDHDHDCCDGPRSCGGCVRGLLCRACNSGVGQLRDDPATLRTAAEYIEGFRCRA